jgi:uncharacterized protein involved in cysteine biosynthesis
MTSNRWSVIMAQTQSQKPESIPLFSPEGVIIMLLAIFADVGGFLLGLIPVVGWFLNAILAILVNLYFFLWHYFKKRMSAVAERRAKIEKGIVRMARITKVVAKGAKYVKWFRWARVVVEFIPYFNFLPLWTISAYLELKYPNN